MEADIIIFSPYFNDIGGIETFTYNLCKQLSKKYDVLMVTKSQANNDQIERIRKVCKVAYVENKRFKCKYLILNSIYANDKIDCEVTDTCYGMIHADYKYLKEKGILTYKVNPQIDKYLAVSKQVQKAFKETYDIDSEVMYNILDEKKPKPLVLISACRLSKEKGYDRMIKLVDELNKRDINFIYYLYCKTEGYNLTIEKRDNLVYVKPRLDITNEIINADYLVQLSDTEGFSYSINEAWQYGVPTITTNFPSIYESEQNGYILDFDLFINGTKEQWDQVIDNIVNKKPTVKFKEKCTIKNWEKAMPNIEKKKDEYNYEESEIEVRCKKNFTDVQTGIKRKTNNKFICTVRRSIELKEKGLIYG